MIVNESGLLSYSVDVGTFSGRKLVAGTDVGQKIRDRTVKAALLSV